VSHAAREWALRQDLKPIPKFILVVLGDAANDQGLCWPRTSTIAGKVGVSPRTVQRAIQHLVKRELITVKQRYRSDGSCSSNLYRLLLGGGDSLSPAPDSRDTTPGHPCQGPPDTAVIPGTTIGTQKESPQPSASMKGLTISKPVESVGEECRDLEYPKALLPAECEEAEKKLEDIPAGLAQLLLDELASSIGANVIQATPLAYLRGLITRAQEGTFTPEGAFRIADDRKRRAEISAAMARSEIRGCDYQLPADGAENPLVAKLLDIQGKLKNKDRQPD
jgi:hypothetical protein